MMVYLKYLKALLRHKWFVFVECRRIGLLWRGVIHDWTKFLPSEFIPYAQNFYGKHKLEHIKGDMMAAIGGIDQDKLEDAFDIAWNHHQKRNRHHWQYWMLTNDSDIPQTVYLPMPDCYVREMIADWRGAGRAYTGKDNTITWYQQHRERIKLCPETRAQIEKEIGFG